MKAKVLFREAALRDVEGILDALAASGPGTAERFASALERGVRRLSEHPEIGHPLPFRRTSLRGWRSWPVPGFPSHLVLHLPSGMSVAVLRVLHGARDPRGLLEGGGGSGS